MRVRIATILLVFSAIFSCTREDMKYSDIPEIDYQSFSLYYQIDSFGQKWLSGDLLFDFTDGDGNIGFEPLQDTSGIGLPDTLLYNLFLQLYDYKEGIFVEVPEELGGFYKYRIPYLDKQPLTGSISIKIDYPTIVYDTIFYSFYLYDRSFNKSNVDTTDVAIFTGIDLK